MYLIYILHINSLLSTMSNTTTSTPYGLKCLGSFQVKATLTPDTSEALVGDVVQNIIARVEEYIGPIFFPEEIRMQISTHQTRMMRIHYRSDELCSKGLHRPRANEIAILENPLF